MTDKTTESSSLNSSEYNVSDESAEPESLDESEYADFMESYVPAGYVEDVKSAIIGDWYITGITAINNAPPLGELSYEPAITFSEDGIVTYHDNYEDKQYEYKIDNSNTLFINGTAISYDYKAQSLSLEEYEANRHRYYLTNYDNYELAIEGGNIR